MPQALLCHPAKWLKSILVMQLQNVLIIHKMSCIISSQALQRYWVFKLLIQSVIKLLTTRPCMRSFTLRTVSFGWFEANLIRVDKKFLHLRTFSSIPWLPTSVAGGAAKRGRNGKKTIISEAISGGTNDATPESLKSYNMRKGTQVTPNLCCCLQILIIKVSTNNKYFLPI